MSKPIAADELRARFLDNALSAARYWADLPDRTPREQCEGTLFSILVMIDGGSVGVPCAFDLVARPNPDDCAFNEGEGWDYVVDGQVINEYAQMHEEISRSCEADTQIEQ